MVHRAESDAAVSQGHPHFATTSTQSTATLCAIGIGLHVEETDDSTEGVVTVRIRLGAGTVVGMLSSLALSASACTFLFSYASIEAPIGTVGEVGIRIQKTHANCTLSSMDDYNIEVIGIQLLGETSWENLGGGLYEKWVQISLAVVGDGSLKISKTCTKEGYEEKVLPITSLVPESSDALWSQAWNGVYPFDEPGDVREAYGAPIVHDGTLAVGALSILLPTNMQLPDPLPESVRLYALYDSGSVFPLLLVGDDVFYRFDHLIN